MRSEFPLGNSCNQLSLKSGGHFPLEKSATNHTRTVSNLIKYNITGGFNSGLKVYLDNGLLNHSKVKRNWFSPDVISIFDKDNSLIVEVRQKSNLLKTKYQITYQNSGLINHIENIEKNVIELADGNQIQFKRNPTGVVSNPYSNIFYKNSEIGQLSNKKIALKLEYTLSLEKEGLDLLPYILIQILTTESNKDYD